MAAGRNKLLKYVRVYANGYDLSGDARTIDRLGYGYGQADLSSALTNDVKWAMPDYEKDLGVFGFQALLNDASGGAFSVLKSLTTGINLSVFLGGGAAPVAGDLAYLLGGLQPGLTVEWEGKTGSHKTDFIPDAGANNTEPWGVVLMPLTALTITTNGSSVNNGAATSNGWGANLHVTVSSGGTWAFKIQDSANNVDWADVAGGGFALNGSAVGSERLVVAGALRQYARVVATRTSGTLTACCGLARF